VDSATQATLTISIPAHACVGSQVLRLATGGEVLDTTFGVYAQTPTLMLGPASAMIGSAPTVNLLGEYPKDMVLLGQAGLVVNLRRAEDRNRGFAAADRLKGLCRAALPCRRGSDCIGRPYQPSFGS
jgi:hypothetical protein